MTPCPDKSTSPTKLITEILEFLIAVMNSEAFLTVAVLFTAANETTAKPAN